MRKIESWNLTSRSPVKRRYTYSCKVLDEGQCPHDLIIRCADYVDKYAKTRMIHIYDTSLNEFFESQYPRENFKDEVTERNEVEEIVLDRLVFGDGVGEDDPIDRYPI